MAHILLGLGQTNYPASAILESAQQLEADLIAMTTHGRGGLGRLVLGSVADEVVRHAVCPLLLVRVKTSASPDT